MKLGERLRLRAEKTRGHPKQESLGYILVGGNEIAEIERLEAAIRAARMYLESETPYRRGLLEDRLKELE